MAKIIQYFLKVLAKAILAKYKPEVVGITGSVGKTSAKDAIFAVLSSKYKTRKNIKNYNNEIGVPLTVIGSESPGRSVFDWFIVLAKSLGLIFFKSKDYPEILVLELAVDKPGDMEYLLSVAECKIGVVTSIGHSHLEYFGTIEKIKKEKGLLVKRLAENGWVALNYDDEKARELGKETKARVITFGFSEEAKVKATELKIFNDFKENNFGINFKLVYDGSAVPIIIPALVSESAVLAVLAAAGVGIAYGMNLVEISKALNNFKQPPGRMNVLKGVKDTIIIDDTYNSSPQSSIAALKTMSTFFLNGAGARKFAILGDMLELGSYSEEGHREVGRKAAKAGVDFLITVGERSRDIDRGAKERGMSEDRIFHFPDIKKTGLFLQERIKSGDLILVKGSQGMRMEKIVKEIMDDPLRAEELLVRQGKEWANK